MSSSLKRAHRSVKRESDDDLDDSALAEEEYKHSRRSPQKVSHVIVSCYKSAIRNFSRFWISLINQYIPS